MSWSCGSQGEGYTEQRKQRVKDPKVGSYPKCFRASKEPVHLELNEQGREEEGKKRESYIGIYKLLEGLEILSEMETH